MGSDREKKENGLEAGCPRGRKEKWAEGEDLSPAGQGVFHFFLRVTPLVSLLSLTVVFPRAHMGAPPHADGVSSLRLARRGPRRLD